MEQEERSLELKQKRAGMWFELTDQMLGEGKVRQKNFWENARI